MFADACQKVAEFVRPVVVSIRQYDGQVKTQCGTFMVLNRDGWIVTAGHIYDSFMKYQTDQNKLKEIRELNESRSTRPGAPSMEVKPDPTYITNHSFWWGWDGVRLNSVFVNRQVDIAVGRLEPFDPSWVNEYPVLKDPAHVRQGTSLCRMGFPFADGQIQSNFDESANAFRIPKFPFRGHPHPHHKPRDVQGRALRAPLRRDVHPRPDRPVRRTDLPWWRTSSSTWVAAFT